MEAFITYWSNQVFGKFQSVSIMVMFGIVGFAISVLFYHAIKFVLIRFSGTSYRAVSRNFNFSLRFFITVVFLNIGIAFTNFQDKTAHLFSKILFILIVFSLAYILIRIIQFIKDILYLKYDVNIVGNLNERRARTQVDFLQKIVTAFVVFVSITHFFNLHK